MLEDVDESTNIEIVHICTDYNSVVDLCIWQSPSLFSKRGGSKLQLIMS